MYPYIIAAGDPGLTTGFAWVDPETREFFCMEDDDPKEVFQALKVLLLGKKRVILCVENFKGSGVLTKEANQTLRVVGMLQYGTCTLRGLEKVVMRDNQARLAFVEYAVAMMQHEGYGTTKGNGADALSALAHALSFNWDENGTIPCADALFPGGAPKAVQNINLLS